MAKKCRWRKRRNNFEDLIRNDLEDWMIGQEA